jgi:hypothetical protein
MAALPRLVIWSEENIMFNKLLLAIICDGMMMLKREIESISPNLICTLS